MGERPDRLHVGPARGVGHLQRGLDRRGAARDERARRRLRSGVGLHHGPLRLRRIREPPVQHLQPAPGARLDRRGFRGRAHRARHRHAERRVALDGAGRRTLRAHRAGALRAEILARLRRGRRALRAGLRRGAGCHVPALRHARRQPRVREHPLVPAGERPRRPDQQLQRHGALPEPVAAAELGGGCLPGARAVLRRRFRPDLPRDGGGRVRQPALPRLALHAHRGPAPRRALPRPGSAMFLPAT